MISRVEEPSGARKGEIIDELREVIDMDEREMVASTAIVSQWLFLLEGLLEEPKEDVLSHSVDDAAVDDAAGDGGVEIVDPKRQVLQLLNDAIQRSSLQVVLPFEERVGVAVPPLEDRRDDYHLLWSCSRKGLQD